MSRTNHYRLCGCESLDAPTCWFHLKYGVDCYWNSAHSRTAFKPTREILGRRPWRRKQRYPEHSAKTHNNPPPRWWWKMQHGTARATYRRLMRSDDPVLPRERDLIDLWGWY